MRQWLGAGTVGIALLVSGCSSSTDDSEYGLPAGPASAAHDDGSKSSGPSSDFSPEPTSPGASSESPSVERDA